MCVANEISVVSRKLSAVQTSTFLQSCYRMSFLIESYNLNRYLVKQMYLLISEQTDIHSDGHCGSMNINAEFKKLLQRLIGETNYCKLDPRYEAQVSHPSIIETAQMRKIMRTFNVFKRDFAKESRNAKLDLPKPLEGLNVASKVVDGELTITQLVCPSALIPNNLSVAVTRWCASLIRQLMALLNSSVAGFSRWKGCAIE